MKIKIIAKCNDMCQISVDELNLQHNGYIPRGLGIGGGDYIRLTIDATTGKIDDWASLTQEKIEDIISPSENKNNS
jgi:hypothetical protein